MTWRSRRPAQLRRSSSPRALVREESQDCRRRSGRRDAEAGGAVRRAQPVPVLGRRWLIRALALPQLRGLRRAHRGDRRRLEACAGGAEVLVVQGGINDIAQSLAGPPAAALRGGRRGRPRTCARWFGAGKELGLEVELADLLPWNNGHPYADAADRRAEPPHRGASPRARTCRCCPSTTTLEDPAEPGLMKPEWTADGDHPRSRATAGSGELALRRLPR